MRIAFLILLLGGCTRFGFDHHASPREAGALDLDAAVHDGEIDPRPWVSFVRATEAVSEPAGGSPPWPTSLSDWTHRLKLEFANLESSEALIAFPLLVTLDAERVPYDSINADGSDLRFIDGDGTELAHEIDLWQPGAVSRIWVRVPQIDAGSSHDFIWLYFGNGAADDAQRPAAVWSSSFAAVYHLGESAGGVDAIRDSTSHGRHGTPSGTPTFATPSALGRGITFPPNGSAYLSLGAADATMELANASFTISCMVNLEDLLDAVLFSAFSADASGQDLRLGLRGYVPEMIYRDDDLQADGPKVRGRSWHLLAFVYDAAEDTSTIYVDGEPIATSKNGPFIGANASYRVGYRGGSSGSYFIGSMDELRVASVPRSSSWLRAQHLALRDRLIHYGASQQRGSPETRVLSIDVDLSSAQDAPLDVGIELAGSATSGQDYQLDSTTLTIAAGQTRGTIEVQIFGDGENEGAEDLTLSITPPPGFRLGEHARCTITLTDGAGGPILGGDDSFRPESYAPVVLDVLANDSAASGAPLAIQSVGAAQHGEVQNLGRHLVYIPNENHPGADAFSYTLSDGIQAVNAEVQITMAAPFTWVGAGADDSWDTPANWLGGAVPDATSTVYFNAQCQASCSPRINVDAQVYGLRLAESFSGSLTQEGANTLALGYGGYRQHGGTFVGGTGNITSFGDVELRGGSFQTTRGTLSISQKRYSGIDASLLVKGGAFVADGGMVSLSGLTTYRHLYRTRVDADGVQFQNLTLRGQGIQYELSGTLTVAGDLTLHAQSCSACLFESLSGGVIEVYGNLTNDSYNLGFHGNTTLVRLVGSGPHRVTGAAPTNFKSFMPILELDTTGDVIVTGNHSLRGGLRVLRAGNVTTTGSLIRFCGDATIEPGGVVFDALLFDCANTSYTFTNRLDAAGGVSVIGARLDMGGFDLDVGGLLDFPAGGTIDMGGGTLSYGSVSPPLGTGGTLIP